VNLRHLLEKLSYDLFMSARVFLLLVALHLLSATVLLSRAICAPLDPIPQTTSSSRQFIVFSRDPKLRIATASQLEEIKNVWLDVAGRPDRWEHPILVLFTENPLARRGPGNVFLTTLIGDANRKRLQIDVTDRTQIATPEFAATVFDALAMAAAMDANPNFRAEDFRRPPLWISQGLVQQLLARKNPPPGGLIEGLVQSGRTPSLASVMRQRSLPASLTEQTIFRMLSFALLRTAIESPGGANAMKAYLRSIALNQTDPGMDGFLAAFPTIGGAESLERLWMLTLARLALPARTNILTARETRAELDKILAIRMDVPQKGGSIETLEGAAALPHVASGPGGQRLAMGIATSLLSLETRANPLWLPLVRSLREIALELARKPRANVRKRINQALETRKLLDECTVQIEDYLNWFEVNRIGRPDPAFAQMFRMQESSFQPAPRTDTLSLTMDKMEALFGTR